jgi:hypothetical protein
VRARYPFKLPTLWKYWRLLDREERHELVLFLLKNAAEDHVMSDSCQLQLCINGCYTPVPAELETEGLCVQHFLSGTERVCSEMRHETAAALIATRRTQIETYISTSAVKLARVGTGSLRLSDEMKRRVLTTFLTLMILRENLDRDTGHFVARVRVPKSIEATAAVAAHS